jgi:3-hydroxybutyryl-CoA dehydrogenase
MMSYKIVQQGQSRSFPGDDAFLAGGSSSGDIVIYLGGSQKPDPGKLAVLVELDLEYLGEHTGEDAGEEGSNVLGFCRYRNGDAPPSRLIELVRQPKSLQQAVDAAKAMFEAAGFEVVVCADQPGRIIDRLVRPKYNAALKFLDEGLATAQAMDMTCRMGLGYADGPVERIIAGGLGRHYDVSRYLHEMTGQIGYTPARRATVAKARRQS